MAGYLRHAPVRRGRGGLVAALAAGAIALHLAHTAGGSGSGPVSQGAVSQGAVSQGSVVLLGEQMAAAAPYHWTGPQWTCLNELWTRESGWRMVWNYAGSGAFGIPQALPAWKMASAGADWMTNPGTQIRWGLGYIEVTYGTPCDAWNHEQAKNWY